VFNGDCYHVVFPSVGGTESGLIRDDRAILEGAGDAIVIISPVPSAVADLTTPQAVAFIMPQQTVASDNLEAVQPG